MKDRIRANSLVFLSACVLAVYALTDAWINLGQFALGNAPGSLEYDGLAREIALLLVAILGFYVTFRSSCRFSKLLTILYWALSLSFVTGRLFQFAIRSELYAYYPSYHDSTPTFVWFEAVLSWRWEWGPAFLLLPIAICAVIAFWFSVRPQFESLATNSSSFHSRKSHFALLLVPILVLLLWSVDALLAYLTLPFPIVDLLSDVHVSEQLLPWSFPYVWVRNGLTVLGGSEHVFFICIFIAAFMSLQTEIDEKGVRIRLGNSGPCLFNASAQSIRSITYIYNQKLLMTAVVKYRTWIGIPLSFGIHKKHYNDPNSLFESISTFVQQQKIRLLEMRTYRWIPYFVWPAIFVTVPITYWQANISNKAFSDYLDPNFPVERFGEVAKFIPLAIPSVICVSLIGLALGLSSAYHRGGFRPFLMATWVWVSALWPSPLIHYLVWTAMYAIFSAIQQPLIKQPFIPIPSYSEQALAYNLLFLLPVFAGVSYVLGVMLGARKIQSPEKQQDRM